MRCWSAVVLLACWLLACPSMTEADVRLEAVTPEPGRTVGTSDPAIELLFSGAVDLSTATADSIRLYRMGDDPLTPGGDDTPVPISEITPDNGDTRLRFSPAESLADGRYSIVVYGSGSERSGPGHALYFSHNLVYLDVDAFKTLGEEFTLEAWTRFDDWAQYGSHTYGTVFDVGQDARDTPGFKLSHRRDEVIFGFRLPDGTDTHIYVPEALEKGEWRHVAGVSSPDGLEIYVNGRLSASIPDTFRPDSLGDYIEVALSGYSRHAGGYDYVLGMFDEMRVWNVARTEEQISTTMHTPLVGDEPGLLLYHPLDQTSGDVLVDVSGHGYDGNRNGTPRQPSEAPLIEMSASALLGVDTIPIDADGDSMPGGVLVSMFDVDTTPPRVVSLEPDLVDCNILLSASSLTIGFDDEMDAATLVAANASLIGSGGDGTFEDGNEMPVALSDPFYDSASRTAAFPFDPPLPDDTYRFTLTHDVQSVVGAALDGEFPGPGGVDEPLPTGDGVPGGNLVLNFSVNSAQDCNRNGRADSCEPGFEDDCNTNEVPDLCDVSSGTSDDCNENTVPDECDIAMGVGEDTNGNGMLDECELVLDRVKPCGRLFLLPHAATDALRAFYRTGEPAGVFLPGQVNNAAGTLGFDANGNLLISQWNQDRVLVVTTDGRLAGLIDSGGLRWPHGATLTPSGEIAVCSYGTDSIKFYDGNGIYLRNLSHGGTEDPKCLAYDRSGYLYVGSRNNGYGRIGVFDDQLDFVRYIGEGLFTPDPTDLAFDRSENLYAATRGKLLKFASDGTLLDTITHSELDPRGIAIDEHERLYVTDSDSLEVFVLGVSGRLLDRLPIGFGPTPPDGLRLYSIALDVLPDADCNGNEAPDACEIDAGTRNDCQFDGVPDECQLDGNNCNDNDIPDDCEPDCNENGSPDDCDIADAGSDDCNENWIPDECDMALANSALRFDGVNDFVRVARDTSLEPEEYTIELWAYLEGEQTRNTRLLRKASSPNGYIFAADQDNDNRMQLRQHNPGLVAAKDVRNHSSYVGAWHHFAGTYDAENARFFVDGELVTELAHDSGPAKHTSTHLYIGNGIPADYQDEHFKGMIDEVRIWNIVRTEEEIKTAMYTPLEPSARGLVGYWRFNEGTGQTASDSSPYANDGALGATSVADVRDPVWIVSDSPVPYADCNGNGVLDECDMADGTSDDCNQNARPDECEPDDDCNLNGVQDICDLFDGTSGDCNATEIPDECELIDNDCNANEVPDECEDCNANGLADECDLAEGTSGDCNTNEIPDECEPDCNENDVTDECDIAGGTSYDFDINGVPDECQPDCNDNGFPDFIDIAFYVSPDCNLNTVPDECDLDEGGSDDCNRNTIPDECDIASETSGDCDRDETPDECEPDWDFDGIPNDCDRLCDFDHDADVDLEDYEVFEICLDLSGPGAMPPFWACLDIFDGDGSSTVDLSDVAELQVVFSGRR